MKRAGAGAGHWDAGRMLGVHGDTCSGLMAGMGCRRAQLLLHPMVVGIGRKRQCRLVLGITGSLRGRGPYSIAYR